jgi:hypothetical protein
MRLPSALVPTLLMCVATIAFPCGGSMSYNIDGPLYSAAGFAERAITPYVDMESYSRDEIRFLPGLLRADSARFAPLLGRAPLQPSVWDTTRKPLIAEPTQVAMNAAWARADHNAAVVAAKAVVDRVMALPAADDPARDSALRLAVETIELAPLVASQPAALRRAAFERLAAPFRGTSTDSTPSNAARMSGSPRQASMAYADLYDAVRVGLPNDSRTEITAQVPTARWDSLHAAHRAWLTRNVGHPYVGLMRFRQLRLYFLASQSDSAWRTAMALYREYPARAGAEMRYMLQVGFLPPDGVLTDASVPAELRAALVGNLRPSAAAWQTLMTLASSNRSAPWAEGLEERLMAMLASDTSASGAPTRGAPNAEARGGSPSAARALPAGFPAWRATASPFWRYVWAVNMLRAGRLDDALKFAAMPVPVERDSLLAEQAAMLATRIHIMRGDWVRALQVPNVDVWTKRYVLRVLAPDSVAGLLLASPDAAVVREARLVLATRAAHRGAWTDAAQLVRPIDAARATRYARIAALARDTTSNATLLRLAQALAANNGQLFYESTRYFYRGMTYRDYELAPSRVAEMWDLPWSREDERQRMYQYLRDGSERFWALQVYASYLGRPGVTSAQRREAVREADRVYRGLLATDPSRQDGYWADSLPVHPAARVIRAAGKS